MQTYYSTRYALSDGITAFKGKPSGGFIVHNKNNFITVYTLGKDCFETEEEALKDMPVRINKKITSHKKSILKLEQIKAKIEKDD